MTPLIEAHRGDSLNAPENTLAAFERAIRLGVEWIELDVHPAKDGTLMVIHDDTVDRTTDGSGAVCRLSVDEMRGLDAGATFSPAFQGERIPRLVDVLEMIEPFATRLNLEIKSSPPGLDVPLRVAELLRRFGKQRDYVVSSFDLQALLDVRAIAPELQLALIGDGPEILVQAGCHHLPWIHGSHTTVSRAIVALAHSQAIRVNVWTVDDPGTLPFWNAVGADKVCTNCPALMLGGRSQIQATDPGVGCRRADFTAAKNVLFVCGRNRRRSPTAEQIFQDDPRLCVRSAGTSESSKRRIKEKDLAWADLVLVMEPKYAARIRSLFTPESLPLIRSLDIPDDYDYMEAELIDLLKAAVEHELSQTP